MVLCGYVDAVSGRHLLASPMLLLLRAGCGLLGSYVGDVGGVIARAAWLSAGFLVVP